MAGYNPTLAQLKRLQDAFREAKAENDAILRKHTTDAFVHTRVYKQAQHGHGSLLIGRKGAGKTALLLGYQEEQREKYVARASIDIRADDFPLEPLFAFFYSDYRKSLDKLEHQVQRISDIPAFVDPVRIAAYAWSASLRSAAVYVAAKQLPSESGLNADTRKRLQKAKKALDYYMGPRLVGGKESGSEVVFSLLIYFFQSIQGLIDKALGIHTHEIAVVLAAITRGITARLAGRLDKRIEDAARLIGLEMERSGKRCLLTLDKFDDYYDEFYRKNKRPDVIIRREFLLALLQGLVVATRDVKRDTRFRWLDALFAVPMDKFLELHLRERVELEQAHVLTLEWTPAELRDYVNRRIAFALDLPPDEKDGAWDKLFPFDVTNATVKDTKENSFLYIVRHTLWRPREIQMYVIAILQRMEEARNPADEEMFRKVVKTESEQIIRREFLEEFASEYPGVSGSMRKLETLNLKSVMSYEDVCDRVAGLKLYDDTLTPADIVLRLFHMGILGVRQVLARERRGTLDPTVTQHKEEVAYRFCYNCSENDPFSASAAVAFHPMFFEYLNIRHEQKYVVNQLAWEMFT